MRLFVAAEIPAPVRSGIEAMVASLRSASLPVRWVRAEGIHVTLKFLGETEPGREPPVREALAIAAASCAPFELEAAGVGTFPERGAPRVVWVGVRGDLEAAARLHRAIETGLAPLGFAPEDRAFQPHLTIGRVKAPGRGAWRTSIEPRAAERFGSFPVRECVLFQSRLEAGGAVYEARARYPLRGAPAE